MTDDSKQKDQATRAAVLTSIEDRSQDTAGTARVKGKVVIVTGVGPAAGIGAQAARLLAREGAAALYLLDVSKDLPAFAKSLQGTFPNTKVSTPSSCLPSSSLPPFPAPSSALSTSYELVRSQAWSETVAVRSGLGRGERSS